MLDTDTKRRIDTARDILVGKVPDPKSQVEQITIALIYKFMDDMDAEAEELGGERSFFAGEFARFRWPRLMAPGLGGFEMLTLYGEAIAKMPENPGIPALFRDIFKNAYLPYRDPETLKSFLKIIDDFRYDHSERLGDAFEYLLSVLGSQGDAGQFRTPRHIIDFMVDVIDPHKDERVLDPACGTAGFLISTYKHVMAANAVEGRAGSTLTPDERKRLLDNMRGYDISPDMVRLSLVNLYLHGFVDPHIVEYDTLTSEDRWNEHYDIILANPPFMSPKGGIRPHKRFSVQSNRSEVLFVDYIAEHLSPAGRAAIIVPEGVIFQSGTAYKTLRKMLVEGNYLGGVISLPAGVFQPYSGVKTSILWIDRALARRTDKVLFVKVENDGFDLGAQRRAIEKNDLPAALAAIGEYKRRITNGESVEIGDWPNASAVEKARLAEGGDYNLSSERYRQQGQNIPSKFALVEIGEICTFEYGKPLKQEDRDGGEYPVFGSNGIVGYHSEYLVQSPFLVVGRKGSAGEVHYSDRNGFPIDTTFYIRLENEDKVTLKFLYQMLKSLDLKFVNTQSGVPGLNRNDAYKLMIPLPPLDVQAEIVAEIEGYQKIIDGARQVVENYRPRIEVDPAWPVVRLGDVTRFIDYRGKTPQKTTFGIPLITAKNVKFGYINREPREYIAESDFDEWMTRGIPTKGDVLFTTEAPLGNVARIDTDDKIALAQRLITLVPDRTILSDTFLMYLLLTDEIQQSIRMRQTGSTVYGIKASTLKEVEIPLPDIGVQCSIADQIEYERVLVAANSELIALFEQKIKDRIAKVWGG